MNNNRAPRVFLVLVLSIITLSLTGAAMIMGSMIYQFTRGERLLADKSAHTESDSLVIHQGGAGNYDYFADSIAGSDAASAVNPATVVVETDAFTDMGVIVGSNGYILTHNVADEDSVTVTLDDGTSCNAKLVARSDRTGMALLKIGEGSLRSAVFAGESAPIGSRLYKIAYIDGEFAVYEGIVSSRRGLFEKNGGDDIVISDIPDDTGGFALYVDAAGRVVAAGCCTAEGMRAGGYSEAFIREFLASAGAD